VYNIQYPTGQTVLASTGQPVQANASSENTAASALKYPGLVLWATTLSSLPGIYSWTLW